MPLNETAQILNPSANWGLILKNTLFAGSYVTNFIVNLLLKFGVPLNEAQVSKIGIVLFLLLIYVVIAFAQALKPIIKILIIIVLVWVMLGFFV